MILIEIKSYRPCCEQAVSLVIWLWADECLAEIQFGGMDNTCNDVYFHRKKFLNSWYLAECPASSFVFSSSKWKSSFKSQVFLKPWFWVRNRQKLTFLFAEIFNLALRSHVKTCCTRFNINDATICLNLSFAEHVKT